MIYDNVHQLKAQLAAQQSDLANKKNASATSGLAFQQEMQAKQMAMQAEIAKTAELGDAKESRAKAGEKFEAFLNSYMNAHEQKSLLS